MPPPIGGGRCYQRRAGHALHAARQSLTTLEEIRARNSMVFAAQYQQEPVPREGVLVNADWFGTYDVLPTGVIVTQSWDTAVKTGVRNDWSVGITARYYQRRFYIIDVIRRRMTFSDLRDSVIASCRQHGVQRLLIEDASSGQQLIQLLQRTPITGVPLPIAVRSEGDKLSRFEAQASRIEAGEVVLPEGAPWRADFLAEVTGFPNARHDDQADALAQLLANAPRQMEAPVNAGPEIVFADGPESYDGYDGYSDDNAWDAF